MKPQPGSVPAVGWPSHRRDDGAHYAIHFPYGKPGDTLWVRESGWEPKTATVRELREGADTWPDYAYDADELTSSDADDFRRWGWKRRPSIHMPRWASRITLEIVDVRVQRLQEIGEDDARAEGLTVQQGSGPGAGPGYKWHGLGYHGGALDAHGAPLFHVESQGRCGCKVAGDGPARCAFRELWDSINSRRSGCSWADSPWVWALTFKRATP